MLPRVPASDPRGFSLVEAMLATVIATIAVVGFAYSFGMGRAFINRFEVARAALGVAQQRLELMHVQPRSSPDFATAPDSMVHVRPFVHAGREVGTEEWVVTWVDDPATPAIANDLKKVTVTVRWNQGALTDEISLSRLFLPN